MGRSETAFTPPATSYDEVLYRGRVQNVTHPARMAAMAALHGLPAPPAARVLELGCGSAVNLLGIAGTLPGSECVGIDLAERPIAEGRAMAAEAGLRNVRLEVGSVADLPEGLGRFDFIVAHGLYSWVPPGVAEALLGAIGRRLAPGGVAYLSYNTYPGWYAKRMVREMMSYHVRGSADPGRRAEQGRALVMLLATATPDAGAFRAALREEADDLRDRDDWYVLHDHLGAENHPAYFHEMTARAGEHGLRWVGKADFIAWEDHLDAEHAAMLAAIAPRERREQYLDFIGNRPFRRDLFARAEDAPARDPAPGDVCRLWFRGEAEPTGPEPGAGADETFRLRWGGELTTGSPPLRAILRSTTEAWPGALGFEEMRAVASARLGSDLPGSELAAILLRCVRSRLVDPVAEPFAFARAAGERPVAYPVARAVARRAEWAPNRAHEAVALGEVHRLLLPLLDGTRDRAALREGLGTILASGAVEVRLPDGRPFEDPGRLPALVAEAVEAGLARIAAAGLLEPDRSSPGAAERSSGDRPSPGGVPEGS